jgi:hypothetical protein
MRNQYLVKTACPSSSGTLRPEHCAGVSVKHIERNQESIKMATKIEQFSYADKVAALTHQYLGSWDNLMAKVGVVRSTRLALRCVCSRPNPA